MEEQGVQLRGAVRQPRDEHNFQRKPFCIESETSGSKTGDRRMQEGWNAKEDEGGELRGAAKPARDSNGLQRETIGFNKKRLASREAPGGGRAARRRKGEFSLGVQPSQATKRFELTVSFCCS